MSTDKLRLAIRREIAALDTKTWKFIPEQPLTLDTAEVIDLIDRYCGLTDPAKICGWDAVVKAPTIVDSFLTGTAVVTARDKGKLVAFMAYKLDTQPFPIAQARAIAIDTSLESVVFMEAVASLGTPSFRALLSLGYETLFTSSYVVGDDVNSKLFNRMALPFGTHDAIKDRSGAVLQQQKTLDLAEGLKLMERMLGVDPVTIVVTKPPPKEDSWAF